ncbi:MAG TPA: class I SAM-dependent methyltransferase [Gaiellaceae bacterium]
MSAPVEKSLQTADVQALFERLKHEVERAGAGDGTLRSRARAAAERFWPVSAERPIERRPGARGLVAYPVKQVLRRLMRWYVEPLAAEQRGFNDAALKLIDDLSERLDRERAAREEAERLLRETEERLLRLERRPAGSAPATVAAQPRAAALPDYFAFESRMRGSTEEIRRRQRPYVDDLRGQAPVLDAGCGRGELLGLLRDAGVEARGVDADADLVAYARGEGLDVEQADALEYLEGIEDGSLGGVFAGQVVEHLPPPALLRLLELAHAKLRPGGVLIAETINPLSPIALRNYFADLTHAQPLVPETLALLARHAGFAETETRYLNAPEPVEGVDPRLNEVVFAPLDYALIARR